MILPKRPFSIGSVGVARDQFCVQGLFLEYSVLSDSGMDSTAVWDVYWKSNKDLIISFLFFNLSHFCDSQSSNLYIII